VRVSDIIQTTDSSRTALVTPVMKSDYFSKFLISLEFCFTFFQEKVKKQKSYKMLYFNNLHNSVIGNEA